MPVFLSPGVKTREIDFSSYVGQISSSIVGMVGGASSGPLNVPTLITSPADFVNTFGEPTIDDFGPISALMFLQQGNQLWYTRVAENAVAAAAATFDGNGPGTAQVTTATVAGSVTADGDVSVAVTAAGMNPTTKTVVVPVLENDTASDVAGKIRTALAADTTVSGFFNVTGAGTSVVLTAKASAGNDTTMNVAITGGTTGVTNAPTSAKTTPGAAGSVVSEILKISFKERGTFGNRFGFTITNVKGKDFKLGVFKDGKVVESFNASFDTASKNFVENVASFFLEFEFDATKYATVESITATADIVPLTLGNDGLPVAAQTVVGSGITGLQSFANADEVDINIICAPGRFEDIVVNNLIQISENRHDCFALIDPPQGLSVQDVIAYHNGTLAGVDYPEVAMNSSYGAVYYPWVKVNNIYTGQDQWIPPSGLVAAVYAYNDQQGQPWFAPAGLNRGKIGPALALETALGEGERDALYGNDNAINPIINYKKQGIVIWGQRTLQREDSATDRVNVRRLMLLVRKSVAISTAYMVFEQNDPITWRRWTGTITPFLESIKNSRGLYDYKVVMDESTVTPFYQDRNEMPGRIYLKPTKTAEFISIDFILTSSGASFGS